MPRDCEQDALAIGSSGRIRPFLPLYLVRLECGLPGVIKQTLQLFARALSAVCWQFCWHFRNENYRIAMLSLPSVKSDPSSASSTLRHWVAVSIPDRPRGGSRRWLTHDFWPSPPKYSRRAPCRVPKAQRAPARPTEPVISLGFASGCWHFGGGGQKWCVSLRLRRKERSDPRRVGPVHLARPERERTGVSILCKSRSGRLLRCFACSMARRAHPARTRGISTLRVVLLLQRILM